VFGIAEYVFWWTTAGAATVVPYALLFFMTRQRRYQIGTGVLAVALVLQAVAYLTSARSAKTPSHPISVSLQELRSFFNYAFEWSKPTDTDFLAFTGTCLLVAVVGVVIYASVRQRSPRTMIHVPLLIGLSSSTFSYPFRRPYWPIP
jgi:hypothetical protein